jgi:hypothetical protein
LSGTPEIEANAVRVTVRERNKVVLEGKVGSWDERLIGPFVYDEDDDDD